MFKIALVGNIASGKSTVENYFIEKGYPVFDTDKICHEILTTSEEIKQSFKDYNVFKGENISREKLGHLVFKNLELKNKLENTIYPLLNKKLEKIFEGYKTSQLVFVSVPLLFEANMQNMFDKIVFVYCEDKIRLKRLIKRNGYTTEYAQIRINAQQPQETKIKKSDYVIENNSDIETLYLNLETLLQDLFRQTK